ncbi:MAG TPA: hypothetical protein VF254_07170 [Gammaproteobacteria bacterium]
MAGCGGGGDDGNPPVAVPPANQSPAVVIDAPKGDVLELSTVTLSAAKSSDPDGDGMTFSWKQVSGIEVELSNANTAEVSFKLPKLRNTEKLEFEVKVTDDNDRSTSKRVEVTAREANGLLYVERAGDDGVLYFYHPSFEQPLKLSPPAPVDGWMEILDHVVFPDHRRAAFVAGSSEATNVIIAELDGSGSHDVTGNVPSEGFEIHVAPSPDGKWLAMLGALETPGVSELFIVPVDSVDGSDRVKVSGEITASDGNPGDGEIDGDVDDHRFAWLPDSSGIVFLGDLVTDNEKELFLGRVDGERVSLGVLPAEERAFAISPSGDVIAAFGHVVGDAAVGEEIGLFAAFADGSPPRELFRGPSALDIGNPVPLEWSPNGEQLAFAFDRPDLGSEELYLVAADQLSADDVRTVGGASADMEVDISSHFAWSPDGAHLAYTGNVQDHSRDDLYVIPSDSQDGSDRVRIPWPDTNSNDTAAIGNIVFSPDGTGIAFSVWSDEIAHQEQLHVAPLTGAIASRISGPTLHDGVVDMHDVSWVNDGSALVFVADSEIDFVNELFRAEADGGGTMRLSPDITALDGQVEAITVSADGTMVAFDLEVDELDQVFIVPADAIDNAESVRISNVSPEDLNGDGDPDGFAYVVGWVGPDPE